MNLSKKIYSSLITIFIVVFVVFFIKDFAFAGSEYTYERATKGGGGSGMDYAYGVAVDKNGNSYIAGSFEQTGVFGDIELTNSGNEDAFISKLAPDGTYLRATKGGGIGDDEAYGVAVDNDGNSYMVGMYNGQSSFGSTTLYGYGERNAFITKVSPTGQFLRVAEGGGNADDRALAVTIDKNGNIYVAGFSQGTSIFGSITLTGDTYGYSNVFIAKISPDGTYQRVTKGGGDSHDFARGIAVDKDGNSYVVGDFFGTATFGATTLISSGSSDTFIAKLAPNGTYLRAVKGGGDNNDIPTSIAIDGGGNIYVAGSFNGTTAFGNTTLTNDGVGDPRPNIFITKLDLNGKFLRAKKGGGIGDDMANGIAVDSGGNIYVAGFLQGAAGGSSTNFGTIQLMAGSRPGSFIAKLSSTGEYITVMTGGDQNVAQSIALDNWGNSYVAGWYEGTATFGSNKLTGICCDTADNNSNRNSFVTKIQFIPDTTPPPIPVMEAEPEYSIGLFNTVFCQPVVDAGVGGEKYQFCVSTGDNANLCITYSDWETTLGKNFSNLINGQKYYYFVRASDGNGNTSDWSTSVFSTQDNEPPKITMLSPAANSNQNTNFKVKFTGSDNLSLLSVCRYKVYDDGVLTTTGYGSDNWDSRQGCDARNRELQIPASYCNTTGVDTCLVYGAIEDEVGHSALISRYFSIGTTTPVAGTGCFNYERAKKLGGTDNDYNNAIVTDNAGNSYIAGNFQLIGNFGSLPTLTSNGNYDTFIAKLNSNGSYLRAVKGGGTSSDRINGVTLDNAGNSYIAGNFGGTATFGSIPLTASISNYSNALIAKLDSNGNYLWATKGGGTNEVRSYGVAVNSAGNSYMAGLFQGTVNFGSLPALISSGYNDVFITKLDANGSYLRAAKGGGVRDERYNDGHNDGHGGYIGGLAVDNAGNSYVAGSFASSAIFSTTASSSSILLTGNNNYFDAFIAKLNSNGIYQRVIKGGGTNYDYARGITVDAAGNSYVAGSFMGTAYFGSCTLEGGGSFVVKLSPTGTCLRAAKGGGVANKIVIDSVGDIYIAGVFAGTAAFGSTTLVSDGGNDSFVAKFSSTGVSMGAVKGGGASNDMAEGISIDSSDNIYVAGWFNGTAKFGLTTLVSDGGYDGFVAKINYSCSGSTTPPDTTPPILGFIDNVEAGPVPNDIISGSRGDAVAQKWMYHTSASCPATEASYTPTSPIPTQTTNVNNGKWICLFGKDSSGNKATLASAFPINITLPDTTPPTCTITYNPPAAGGPVDDDVIATCTPSEPVTFQSPAGIGIYTFVNNGSYIFNFTDLAGNVGTATATVTWIDKDAPKLTQVIPVPSPTRDNTPDYTFNSTKAGTITYGGSCNSSNTTAIKGDNKITFNTLADGTYSNCTIQVTDNKGRTSIPLAVNTFIVDTIPPEITITIEPDTVLATGRTITAVMNEQGTLMMTTGSTSTICNSSRDSEFQPYASQTFTGKDNNGKYVCYRGVDLAGNTGYKLSDVITGLVVAMSYKDMKMTGGRYTSCEGTDDEYSIYGQIAYTISGETYSSHMVAGTKYDRSANKYIPQFLVKSLQRFDNKYPIGYIYDEIGGGIGFVGGNGLIADYSALITELNKGLSGINNFFKYVLNKIKWNSIEVETTGSASNTLMNIGIQGNVGLSFSLDTAEKNRTLGNLDKKTLMFNTLNVNFSKLINTVRKNAENLCKGKYEDGTTFNFNDPKNLFCIEFDAYNANKIININNSDWQDLKNKTLVVKNGNVAILGGMDIDGGPVNIFIDKGNLLISNNASNLVGFDGNGYPKNPRVSKGLNLKGNFIVNGLIIGVNNSSRAIESFKHKLFLNGKFASLNTPNNPNPGRIAQVEALFGNDTYKNWIRLEKIFTWQCNPITGKGDDGTNCGDQSDKYAEIPLIIIDGYYPSGLIQ